MANHALRGAASAWLTLIALRAVGQAGGSGRITSLVSDFDGLVTRALSSDVPAVADRRAGAKKTGQPTVGISAADAKAASAAAAGSKAVTAVTSPGGLLNNIPNLQAIGSAGDLSGLLNNPALK